MALAARAAKVSGTRLGCAATRARAPAARAACLRVSAKWVLQPTGTGDCSHLDRPVPLPSPVVLSEEKLIIGREASGSVTLALPVPTGASLRALALVLWPGAVGRRRPTRLTHSLRRAASLWHARHDRPGCGPVLCDRFGQHQRVRCAPQQVTRPHPRTRSLSYPALF